MAILTGQDDRQTKHLRRFITTSIYGSVGIALVAVFGGIVLGGGNISTANPLDIISSMNTPDFNWENFKLALILGLLAVLIFVGKSYIEYQQKKNTRLGEEHGTSKFLTAKDLPRFNQLFFYDPAVVEKYEKNVKTYRYEEEIKTICEKTRHRAAVTKDCFLHSQIMGQDVYLSMNTKFINRNLNTITIGGSGQGKSYSELFPNALNANANYVFTDPSGEIFQKVGKFLERQGYRLIVFNVDDFSHSLQYNPLAYIEKDSDYAILVNALNKNIDPEKKSGGANDFFDKAQASLVCALIAALKELYPEEPNKQNLMNIMELLRMAEQVTDKDGNTTSLLDETFKKLRKANSRSYAARMWQNFRVGGPKVCNEVIVSATAIFGEFFDSDELAFLTMREELHLEDICSEKKCALFITIPQHTDTYNFMASMIYSQLFELVDKKGKEYRIKNNLENPGLPRHVSFWLDEFANIGKIPRFIQLLSVIRKYNASINIILQSMSQIKSMYPKEEWEIILGNLDTMIYLGGMEPSTVKWLSEKLGKETITQISNTNGKNNNSSSFSYTGRSLMTPDEIEQMPRANELIFVSGCKPIMTKKYNLALHPNFKYCGEADKKNNYNIHDFIYREVDYDLLMASLISEKELEDYDFVNFKVMRGAKQISSGYTEEDAKKDLEAKAEKEKKKNGGQEKEPVAPKSFANMDGCAVEKEEKDRIRNYLANASQNLNQDAVQTIIENVDLTNIDTIDGFMPAYEFLESDFVINDNYDLSGLDNPDEEPKEAAMPEPEQYNPENEAMEMQAEPEQYNPEKEAEPEEPLNTEAVNEADIPEVYETEEPEMYMPDDSEIPDINEPDISEDMPEMEEAYEEYTSELDYGMGYDPDVDMDIGEYEENDIDIPDNIPDFAVSETEETSVADTEEQPEDEAPVIEPKEIQPTEPKEDDDIPEFFISPSNDTEPEASISAEELADKIEKFCYETNVFDYREEIEDREEFKDGLTQDLNENGESLEKVIDWFKELSKDNAPESKEAENLLQVIYEFQKNNIPIFA